MPFDSKTTLRARWSKKEGDVIYEYPSKPDGHLLHNYIGCERMTVDTSYMGPGYSWMPSLLNELEKRGYDITTLKFSIKKKKVEESGLSPQPGND